MYIHTAANNGVLEHFNNQKLFHMFSFFFPHIIGLKHSGRRPWSRSARLWQNRLEFIKSSSLFLSTFHVWLTFTKNWLTASITCLYSFIWISRRISLRPQWLLEKSHMWSHCNIDSEYIVFCVAVLLLWQFFLIWPVDGFLVVEMKLWCIWFDRRTSFCIRFLQRNWLFWSW